VAVVFCLACGQRVCGCGVPLGGPKTSKTYHTVYRSNFYHFPRHNQLKLIDMMILWSLHICQDGIDRCLFLVFSYCSWMLAVSSGFYKYNNYNFTCSCAILYDNGLLLNYLWCLPAVSKHQSTLSGRSGINAIELYVAFLMVWCHFTASRLPNHLRPRLGSPAFSPQFFRYDSCIYGTISQARLVASPDCWVPLHTTT
jgi:hypothetical protein